MKGNRERQGYEIVTKKKNKEHSTAARKHKPSTNIIFRVSSPLNTHHTSLHTTTEPPTPPSTPSSTPTKPSLSFSLSPTQHQGPRQRRPLLRQLRRTLPRRLVVQQLLRQPPERQVLPQGLPQELLPARRHPVEHHPHVLLPQGRLHDGPPGQPGPGAGPGRGPRQARRQREEGPVPEEGQEGIQESSRQGVSVERVLHHHHHQHHHHHHPGSKEKRGLVSVSKRLARRGKLEWGASRVQIVERGRPSACFCLRPKGQGFFFLAS